MRSLNNFYEQFFHFDRHLHLITHFNIIPRFLPGLDWILDLTMHQNTPEGERASSRLPLVLLNNKMTKHEAISADVALIRTFSFSFSNLFVCNQSSFFLPT